MDDHSKKESLGGYTSVAVLISVMLLVFALFLALSQSREADFSWAGILWLLKNNPVFWILLTLSVLFPLAVYLLSRRFYATFARQQEVNAYENERIEKVTAFTQQLIHDNLDVNFDLAGEDDLLGKTLLNLRDTLKTNQDNNIKLRQEEEKRNWIAEGLAHFSEILRNYIHDPDKLAFHIIKDITKYVNAIQGGFYLLNDDDPHNRFFDLKAFFAFDRRKFADQQIKWGDGLIGTCALEQKSVHLKSIPEGYITVTSGLGEANPDNLVVVPMMYEGQVYGVLELASFHAFDEHQTNLLEKTAESVAATLSAIKTNQRTAYLLEESKAQTQALTSHEEEMRQNMEELQATQEEAMRQSKRLEMLENTLDKQIIMAEFDNQGLLITANGMFRDKFEFGGDLRLQGKPVQEILDAGEREKFEQGWNLLIKEGKPIKGTFKHVTRTGKDLWAMVSVTALKDDDQGIDRIMYTAMDASAEKALLHKHEAIVESVDHTGIRIELDVNGNLLDCNKNFIDLFKLSQKDVKSLVVFDIIHPTETESFNKRWEGAIRGQEFAGIIRAKKASGEDIWLNGTVNALFNAEHEVERIVFAGTDVTNEKQLGENLKTALETLKKQEKIIKDAEKELTNKIRETKAELINQFKETERIKSLTEKMLEDLADAVVTTSHDNRIIFFNKAAEELFQLKKGDVLENDVNVLFPESVTEKDELLASFTHPGDHKITGKRKKCLIIDKKGKEKQVYVLLSKSKAEGENAYTAFIQQI